MNMERPCPKAQFRMNIPHNMRTLDSTRDSAGAVPFALSAAAEGSVAVRPEIGGSGAAPVSPKATILIVDDEPDVRDVLEEYFVAHGYATISAASASAAAAAPISGERQPLVTPMARMIVSASTASTADARKVATTRIIALVATENSSPTASHG
jgi:hypothetical protein